MSLQRGFFLRMSLAVAQLVDAPGCWNPVVEVRNPSGLTWNKSNSIYVFKSRWGLN